MIYQKLLTGEKPYFAKICSSLNFSAHRHPEAEFLFCLKGSFDVTVNGCRMNVSEGEFAAIAPMSAHEFDNPPDIDRSVLVIEFGAAMHGAISQKFTSSVFEPAVKSFHNRPALAAAVNDAVQAHRINDAYSELSIIGSIYNVAAALLREYADNSAPAADMRAVANIEKALELIRTRYTDQITVDDAAYVTGYGKSNFCKLFKRITGETFHDALNRRRVENARFYLSETALPVSEIAPLVGFYDVKSFHRVFKAFEGMSPGQYRRGL